MAVALVNGQEVTYTDTDPDGAGDEDVIIWSHGFLTDHSMFDPQVDAFEGWRSVAWDERGFGGTAATEPFTYWDSADDAVALLDHLGIDRAVFAGMSQGGYLSLRAALAHPDRVRALVLIDTQSGADDPAVLDGYRGMLTHWMSDEPLDPVADIVAGLILGRDDLAAHWIAIWHERRAQMTEFAGNALLDRDDITDRLSEIDAPALVVHGDADVAISIDHGRALAGALSNSTLAVIEAGTHASNLTHPDEVNAAIAAFLDGLS